MQNVKLAILFLEGKSHDVIQTLQDKMENAANHQDYELASFYRDQITRLRQIQSRQYINVAEGNLDVVGYAKQSHLICMQLLSIRAGQLLGSRSYFPMIPLHSTMDEVISSFLIQHYLSGQSHIEAIPHQIIIESVFEDQLLLERVLTEQAKHKVKIMRAVRGEKKKWLMMAVQNAKLALSAHLYQKTNMQERLQGLQDLLGLTRIPHRLECFDVSHSMGEATVASCVVFNETGPIKNDYRRFNIENITPGDDVAAMHQALLRRFKRLQKNQVTPPDIVFVDGGLSQLNTARQVMDALSISGVTVVGVAKGPSRKPGLETLYIEGRAPISLPPDSPVLHFIQQIRDEAHRFAITGHRQKRDKTRRKSTLESIPGIGAKRRREILRYFGGIQGVAHASLDELINVPGISRALAEKIFAAFHDTLT
jgi:excinuclease ABC subunit C